MFLTFSFKPADNPTKPHAMYDGHRTTTAYVGLFTGMFAEVLLYLFSTMSFYKFWLDLCSSH